jgi:NAD(P)-dependent dehydrogenase (short-subunit alcohol dehydrogenase family)
MRRARSGSRLRALYGVAAQAPEAHGLWSQIGRIVVTTSIAALKTETVIGTAYPVAKAGAAHLVRQAALELARYNIRVNPIAPGPFLDGGVTLGTAD